MDFRAMLKKRKYAKWGKDKEDPDWTDLKEVEKPVPQLKKVEKLSENVETGWFEDGDQGWIVVKVEGEEICKIPAAKKDKPARPKGPLKAEEIRADHVKLKWQKPEDNGGSEITGYVGPDKDTFTVDGLTPKKKYKFRVKAVNKEGESEPLETDDAILAKNPYGEFQFMMIDGFSFSMKYILFLVMKYLFTFVTQKQEQFLKPLVDQFAKEGKEKKVVFDAVFSKPNCKPKWFLRKDELFPGSKYKFINENDVYKLIISNPKVEDTGKYTVEIAGIGCTAYLTVDEPDPVYSFIRPLAKKTDGFTLHECIMECTVSNSMAVVSWYKGDQKLEDGPKYEISKDLTGVCKLTIKSAILEDSGEYSCRIEKQDDKTVTQTTIVGKPGKPKGPLQVLDVHKEGCRLQWQKPDDDGGSPIREYEIEKMDTATGKWVRVGRIPGDKAPPEIEVTGLTPGHEYQFRVVATNDEGDSEPLTTELPIIAKNPFDEPSKPGTPQITDYDNESVDLKWTAPNNDGGAPIEKYIIEKKDKVEIKNLGGGKHQLVFNKAELTDEGEVVCESGKLSSSCKITVKKGEEKPVMNFEGDVEGPCSKPIIFEVPYTAAPSKPKGPLKVSDVTKNGCKLKWEKPEDDGGLPVTGYVVEKLDKSTGRWVPVGRTTEPEMDVHGLTEGHEYQFRVKAVNEEGESEPLETERGTIAKNPYDVPGKPGVPEFEDWDVDRVDLKWEAPKFNGGAPITDQLAAKVPDLKERAEYQFRVIAVNKAGLSPASEPTDMHKVKFKALRPIINREKLQKVTVRAGQFVKFDVDIKGEPPPKVTWKFAGKELENSPTCKIENVDYNTKIMLSDTTRKDTGIYTIIAENDSGKDEATVEVIVLDKPGKPEGPLEVSDVHKEGCKLKWNKPKDDGGLPLTSYIVEKMDTATGRWVPAGFVDPDKTELEVKDLEPNKKYHFRVKAVNEEGESEPLETDTAILAKNPFDPPSPPGLPELVDWNENMVKLKWEPPIRDGGAPITGYVIEMMDKYGGVFVKCAEVQGNVCQGTVNKLEEGNQYQFRVRAINKAGQSEPSEATNPHIAKARFLKPRIDRTNLQPITVKVGLQVTLDINIIGEPPPVVTWTFKDKVMKNVALCMEIIPFRLLNCSKPGKPKGPLEVADVTKHGCKLKWKKPEDDGGAPIEYYEIEKLDPLTGQWIPCGKSTEPEANVTGLQEGKPYKFRVRAVNKEGESEELETDKPIIAKNPFDEPSKPGRPEIRNWDKDFVDLEWSPPKSDGGAPIEKYIVQMRDKEGRNWVDAATSSGDRTAAKVTAVEEGHEYEFRIVAVNKAGPSEPSDPSKSVVAKPRFLAPYIDRKNLQKKIVRTGQMLRIEADVKGEPPPKITWSLKEQVLKPHERLSIQNEDYKTTFILQKAKRSDTGLYTVMAVNDSGKDQVEVEIAVLSKPSKPKGPLKVSDVKADGCKLKWEKPDDDGGEPVDHYLIERMDTETGRWVPAGTSKTPEAEKAVEIIGNKCEAKVPDLVEGMKYQFRVKAVNKGGQSKPSDPSDTMTAKARYAAPYIDRSTLRDLIIKAGQNIRFDVKITGEPPPSKSWFLNKARLDSKGNVSIENEDYKSKLIIPTASRKDSGTYLIKAENSTGKDEATVEVTVLDRPAKPEGPLKISDVHKEGCSLKWNPPKDDGGSPIEHYAVEKMDTETGYMMWEKATETNTATPQAVVSGLIEGNEYQFRVIAVNKAGPSEPSDASKNIIAKPRFLAPRIDRRNLHDVTLSAGSTLKYDVNVTGEPPPNIEWRTGSGTLRSSKTVHIDNIDYNTKLVIRPVQRGDSGEYTIIASNSSGKDTVTVNVTVTDKPSAPEGPLQVSDVHKEGCKLKWKRPRDDGGTPIEYYQVEKMDPESGLWVPCGRSQEPEQDGGSPITGYIIEKKDKFNPSWEKCAEVEGDITTGKVPDLIEGNQYEFRIRAVNKAGPGEPSDSSKPHIARPKNLAPRIDRNALLDIKVRAGQNFDFDVPVIGEPPPSKEWTLKGNMVINTDRIKVINEDYNTKFRVIDAKRIDSGTYTLTAKNINGVDSATVNVTVLDVPQPPEGPLKPENITKSSCTLYWRPPKDDGGSEISYYTVEKLDTENMRWVPVGDCNGTSMRVDYLIEGHDYNFRVKAVNKQGESLPLTGTSPITAKDPFGKPEKPGTPEPVDWDRDHVDLQWTPPKKDGGSPITSYIIEKRTRFGPWEKAAEVPGNVTKGTAPNLIEGEEYEFRVIAVNKGGPGEPSEASKPVIAKPRFQAPVMDTTFLQDLVVRAGQRISYNIPIEASPRPKVTWTVNGKPIAAGTRADIQTFEKETVFEIPFSVRSDTGKYTIKLENDLGFCSASAHVTVLDRPSPPQGPMVISDITKEGAHLSWKIPADDGGSPILHYVIEKMDLSRGTWSDAGMSLSLSHDVIRLIHRKEYLFRVKAVNSVGESDPLEAPNSIIAKNEFDEPDSPGKPAITDWDKDHVDLEWTPPKSDGGSPITGYIIQKKEKGSPYWVNAASAPAGKTSGSVPDLTPGQDYEFRVIAVNKAGPSEPSEPSDVVTAKERYLAPKIKTPLNDVRIKAGQIIHVDIDFIGEPIPEVIWTISGNPIKTDERTTLTAIGYHTIVHTVNAKRSDSGTYNLMLRNSSGIDEGSFQVVVLDRPGPPEAPLEYEEITAQSVTLSWKPPKDNGGSEITAYVIEKKDVTHGGGWVPAVAYVNPKYNHATVPRLIEGTKYEFRVFAENLQGRSDPLVTAKPVVAKNQFDVPGRPGKPDAVDSDKDHIKIKWTPPISNGGSPILGYEVERRDRMTGRWVKLTKEPTKHLEYYDDRVTEGHQYEYRVTAVNAAGPGKPSDTSNVFAAKPMKEKPKLYLDGIIGKKIKVRAGEPIIVHIPMTGAPTPTVEWTKNTLRLPDSNRISYDTNSDSTTLRVEASTRNDSGKYTITAKNEFGKDSADIEVIVVDKPGMPKGPLTYTATTQDSVSMSWSPPTDDGGGDITGYIIEMTEFGTDSWRQVPGFCPKPSFTVKGLSEGKRYVFRVRAENIYGVSEPLEGKPVVAKSPFDPPDAPSTPEITAYSPNSCSYYVEKRERGGEWIKCNNYPTPNTSFTAQDLREGSRYEFRVIAVNEAGPGKPSKPTEPITAQAQRFKPDTPEPPKPDRITKDSVTLSWRPPRSDGGAKIKGYIVQKKAKGDAGWTDVNDTPVPANIYKVPNLKEGDEYQFRVIAVNEVGPSDPSRPSPNILIEEQPNKPCMDLGGIRDITVRAGEDFSIHVPFTAFPKPTASWFANDALLDETDPRVFQQLADDYASLVVKNSKRSDSGQYRLQLRNQSGFDTATITVRVLDRPGPPENLRADEFAGDALTLYWNAPKDNGGSEITNYIVEKKEARTPTWSKVSSYVTTSFCRIRNLVIGRMYEFRVMAENQYGVSDPAVTSDPIKARHPFDVPGAPGSPRGVETSEDSITISWTKPRHDGGSPITGYIVEKRLISDDQWTKASHALCPDTTMKVINLIENHEYEFRVAAVNAAGQGPFSSSSDSIWCRPPPSAPKITSDLSIRDMTVIAGEEFTITVPFTAIPKPKPTWNINGEEVIQSDRIKFETSTTATVFLNKCAKRSDSGNYTIQLSNSEGSDSASCKVLVVGKMRINVNT
ncbi:hypothetical protein J437_LFUL018920 [Ladona fulva]|uniref:Twitchin n=1 Tax=Ladona fulva TaxID=123851 RepID=A0A8K0KST5_LADFU|nr:hypothetical protein J437_LFUL018920 [Ladona fulva]